MSIPAGLLESLFEERDGAALTLSTARARVTITRMETDYNGPTVWKLSGDRAYGRVEEHHTRECGNPEAALSMAIAILEAHSNNG